MRLPDPLLESRSPRPYPQLPLLAQIPAGAAKGVTLVGKAWAQLPTRICRQEKPVGLTGGDGGEVPVLQTQQRNPSQWEQRRGDTNSAAFPVVSQTEPPKTVQKHSGFSQQPWTHLEFV